MSLSGFLLIKPISFNDMLIYIFIDIVFPLIFLSVLVFIIYYLFPSLFVSFFISPVAKKPLPYVMDTPWFLAA